MVGVLFEYWIEPNLHQLDTIVCHLPPVAFKPRYIENPLINIMAVVGAVEECDVSEEQIGSVIPNGLPLAVS